VTPALSWYLILGALLFSAGLYTVLARRNGVIALMGIVLILNSVTLNLVAFWRYAESASFDGQVFAMAVIVITIAQVAVGLGLIVALWRRYSTAVLDEADALKE